ncbi:MAG TPA: class I SAM-dependent methyltransferase [Vulgatibacter sp.]|nr:class I SAM-dependent methyltransferase [Vulgatibacter sp.]
MTQIMATPVGSPFTNRLRKVAPRRLRQAARDGLSALRLYDADVPEYAFTVDWYAGHAVVTELVRRGFVKAAVREARRQEVERGVMEVLGIPEDRVHWKVRSPKRWGEEQYEKLGERGERIVVEEQGLRFLVNLDDYLDTGLFLDHRLTRARVRDEARGKRFLNLFCYTGSFTVYATAGGARETVSVDLSNTYLGWARDNLALNGLDGPQHHLVRSDVTRWLRQVRGERFDLVVLDPPPFSASKKMASTFDVQRDHVALLEDTAALVAPGGAIYFSTNFQGFELAPDPLPGWNFEELTPATIPPDFRNRKIHRCWRISNSAS